MCFSVLVSLQKECESFYYLTGRVSDSNKNKVSDHVNAFALSCVILQLLGPSESKLIDTERGRDVAVAESFIFLAQLSWNMSELLHFCDGCMIGEKNNKRKPTTVELSKFLWWMFEKKTMLHNDQ